MQLLARAFPCAASEDRLARRGAVALLTAILLVLLIGFTGLMLDTARVRLTAQELQRAADAAAAAAVPFLDDPDGSMPPEYTYARNAALNTALANKVASAGLVISSNIANAPGGDVVVGTWDAINQVFVPLVIPTSGPTPIPTACKVTARKTAASANGALPLIFGPAFGTSYSDVTRSAVAVRGAPKDPLVFVLDPTGPKSMWLQGSANLDIQSGVAQINSSNGQALYFGGNSATFTASGIRVVGGCSGGPPANLVTGAPVLPDPFLGLAFPAQPYTPMVPAQITAGGTYGPGYYPGGIKSSSIVTLTPGTYILGDPGIELTGGGLVTTQLGVVVCLLKRTPSLGLTRDAGVTLKGNSSLQVRCPQGPSAGLYNGIAIYMQPGNGATISIQGTGALTLEGYMYCPDGTLDLSGTGFYSIGGIDVFRMVTSGSGNVTGIAVPPGHGAQSVYLVE